MDTSWFRTADKLRAPNWPTLYNSASYNGQTGNHTYLSCRNLLLEEHENFNVELQSVAIAIVGRQCLMGQLLLWSSMQLIGLVDQLSVHIWQGRESEETIVDRSTDLASGCFRFSSTWWRSLLLSFNTCYLGTLGLEGAKNCILAWASHQRTTSEKRTKALLRKCPLFGGSTVYILSC